MVEGPSACLGFHVRFSYPPYEMLGVDLIPNVSCTVKESKCCKGTLFIKAILKFNLRFRFSGLSGAPFSVAGLTIFLVRSIRMMSTSLPIWDDIWAPIARTSAQSPELCLHGFPTFRFPTNRTKWVARILSPLDLVESRRGGGCLGGWLVASAFFANRLFKQRLLVERHRLNVLVRGMTFRLA